jgi:hypothetical protein
LLNEQGKALGFAQGDILMKLNGEPFPETGVLAFLEKQKQTLTEGGTISYTVLRKNETGEWMPTELKAPVQKIDRKLKHVLEFNPNATPEQIAHREYWLSPQEKMEP